MDESTTALLGDAYDGGVAGSGSVQVAAIKGEPPPPIMRGKTTLGILIVTGIAVSWVGATQASKSAYTAKAGSFHAPFFSM